MKKTIQEISTETLRKYANGLEFTQSDVAIIARDGAKAELERRGQLTKTAQGRFEVYDLRKAVY